MYIKETGAGLKCVRDVKTEDLPVNGRNREVSIVCRLSYIRSVYVFSKYVSTQKYSS